MGDSKGRRDSFDEMLDALDLPLGSGGRPSSDGSSQVEVLTVGESVGEASGKGSGYSGTPPTETVTLII